MPGNRVIDLNITKEQFAEMYGPSMTQEQLARHLGISVASVRRLAKEWGFHRKRRRSNQNYSKMTLTKEQFSDIYFSTGRSPTETSKHLNISAGCVTRWARRWGLCRVHKKMALTREQLEEMYVKKQMGMKEIGLAVGMSKNSIHTWITKYGLRLSQTEKIQRIRSLQNCTGEYPSAGYVMVYVPDHPNARGKCLEQHRIVAEQMLGRLLEKGEFVHHIDMIRNDNREGNLAVFQTNSDHSNTHVYYQHFGLYCLGLIEKPLPLKYSKPVLWGGKWIDALDLTVQKELLCP